jgi:hypothetical protein
VRTTSAGEFGSIAIALRSDGAEFDTAGEAVSLDEPFFGPPAVGAGSVLAQPAGAIEESDKINKKNGLNVIMKTGMEDRD